MNSPFPKALLLAVLTLPLCPSVLAGVIVNGTRVIYPAQAREVTMQIDNVGDAPSLVQAWIDSGNPGQSADASDAPFVLTPPISRIEPGRSQALRIIFSGKALPSDRESVFWLNVLDVPPAASGADGDAAKNYLQVAFRSRIKLFYRPQGLPGEANDAPQALRWQRLSSERMRIDNPTPYYVTLAEVHAGADATGPVLEDKGQMLAPGASIEMALPAAFVQVQFVTINDFGGRVPRTASVVAGP
ncbi:MAG: fimbria/pilus periplasmic chaperone [Xanthomonas sp.]